jgi:hypothetical protein
MWYAGTASRSSLCAGYRIVVQSRARDFTPLARDRGNFVDKIGAWLRASVGVRLHILIRSVALCPNQIARKMMCTHPSTPRSMLGSTLQDAGSLECSRAKGRGRGFALSSLRCILWLGPSSYREGRSRRDLTPRINWDGKVRIWSDPILPHTFSEL